MNWARQDARECTMHNKSETNNDSKHWKRTLREGLLFTSVELPAWSARVRNRRRQHRPHRPSVEPSLFSSPRALHNSILKAAPFNPSLFFFSCGRDPVQSTLLLDGFGHGLELVLAWPGLERFKLIRTWPGALSLPAAASFQSFGSLLVVAHQDLSQSCRVLQQQRCQSWRVIFDTLNT